ncbi:hypothetical protein [Leadbetterella sp. DM7]|uniref:hypothetical protein n=1 Tax=Leadbetterella sp. DM7 TaxID=3235085 RepID=UPI00349EDD7E
MLENGLQNVYKLGVDYLPVTHYILYVYALLAGSTEAIILNINSLKLFTFAIELIGIFYVYQFIRERYKTYRQAALFCLLILLNPAFLYDSLLYGQWDGIYTTLVFMSFYYATRNRLALSILFFFIALNAKIQALVYLPLIGFVCLEHMIEKFEPGKVLKAFIPMIIFQVLILLPFALTGDLLKVYHVAVDMVGRYPLISMGANNFWFFIFENPVRELDVQGHWGLSYNSWGLLAFCLAMMVIFVPMLIYFIRKIQQKDYFGRYPVDKLLMMGILIPIVFFYFNTQMHARYAHSAILFAGCYALYTHRFLIYGLVSVAYFLNLEIASKILKGNILEYEQFFMRPRFVAFLFGIVLIMGLLNLYRGTGRKTISE